MAQTFAYDLVRFLRVLYLQRWFIVKGTVCVTILVMIASLLWPQTWRADARILVSTPKFKSTLKLIDEPFDVLTYRGIMTADSLYSELIDTLKWYKESLDVLLQQESQGRLETNLPGKAEMLNPYQLIENTNLPLLEEILVPEAERGSDLWDTRLYLLGHLSEEEMLEIENLDRDEIDDISVFDLRKMLHANVSIVKETNLETVYSRLISVSAEFGTAVGAKMVANTWIGLFEAKAERIARSSLNKQIAFTRGRAASLESLLAAKEKEISEFKNTAMLQSLRAQTASKLIALTGVATIHKMENRTDESFDLENENEPFMKERREQLDSLSFSVVPSYETALIPERNTIEKDLAVLKRAIELGVVSADDEDVSSTVQEYQSELDGLNQQITALETDVLTTLRTIRRYETELAVFEREKQQLLSSLMAMQPLLDEASLLESQDGQTRYADISSDRAIKPDKRVSPKRSYMTIAGCGLSFLLFCALAFFRDIWNDVTRPE